MSKMSVNEQLLDAAKEKASKYVYLIKDRSIPELVNICHEARHMRSIENNETLWHFYTEVIILLSEHIRIKNKETKDLDGLLEYAKNNL